MLALIWGVLGYASVFDLGIGRAATQYLSEMRGRGNCVPIRSVTKIAVGATLKISSVGVAALLVFTSLGAYQGISANEALYLEVGPALYILCLIIPLQSMAATYRGVSEAFDQFRAVGLIRALQGALNFAGPVLVSTYSAELHWAVASLLVSRLIGLWLYRRTAYLSAPAESLGSGFDRSGRDLLQRRLLKFGGWATVSSIISPLMVQSDRFFIAALLSAAAVTMYTLPFDVVTQALVFVGAFTTVAFPALSRVAASNPADLDRIAAHWALVIGSGALLLCISIALALPLALPAWSGGHAGQESVLVGQILCAGVFFNAVGSIFYAKIHAKGDSATTAKIHLLEFPFYIAALFFLLNSFGIKGAALAWSSRMAVDAVLLYWAGRSRDVAGVTRPK